MRSVLLRTQTDARLVALARAGHDRAFEAIVERYRRPLLRACRRILPEARAEDALQQALVAAWTALRRGDEVHELRPWLYRIVRNTALNQLRVVGYDLEELVDTLAAADDPEEEVERRALMRDTLAAVAALPERQRDALLRMAIEGQGQDEVARDLGLSSTAVRQLVYRARVSVRTAATAVVPLPLAAWLAAGAGGTATLAKAGAVAVLAGGAVAAPAVIDAPPEPARDGPARPSVAAATGKTAPPAADDARPGGGRADDSGGAGDSDPGAGRTDSCDDRHGDDRGDDDDARAARGGGDDDGEECGDDALTAGATVLEAELEVRDGEAVWTELELLKS